jgi:hypothetical protein
MRFLPFIREAPRENVSARSLITLRRWGRGVSRSWGLGAGGFSLLAAPLVGCSDGGLGQQGPADGWGIPTSEPTSGPTSPAMSGGPSTNVPEVTVPSTVPAGSATGTEPGVSTGPQPTTPPVTVDTSCESPQPGRSPLRRLTRFEYSNTIQTLLGTDTDLGQRLPAELLGNGFGNDADNQPTSPFLIEQYSLLAAELASQISSPEVAARYDGCLIAEAPDEVTCARSFLSKFAEAAYRRPLQAAELDELVALQQVLREQGDWTASVSGAVEAVLQSPDFLYRVEFGEDVQGARRLTGHEMASRLSYFFWGAPPDQLLLDSAADGTLEEPEGVAAQAERLLDDPRARQVVQFFFDSLLPINNLTDQTRDVELFPTFSAQIGNLQHEEVSQFLMHEIFEANGSWDSILTAPYTYVNEQLANFYGMTGVQGEQFVKVDVDTTKRLGLLTQGGVLTGTTVTNMTNPVRRGGFLLSHVLCIDVPLPSEELAEEIKPPEPYSGSTGRERFSAHSQDDRCSGCHALLDPPGFALENYDAVGLWRDQENGVTIDASGNLPGIGSFSGPVELVQRIAENPATYSCFAQQWQKFGYGRKLDEGDKCNKQQLTDAFEGSGHNVKQLLLALTQTDGFRYLGTEEQL